VFNEVVWWRRLGEVENVYVAYNFSHFVIYLPKFILKLVESSNKNKNAVFF